MSYKLTIIFISLFSLIYQFFSIKTTTLRCFPLQNLRYSNFQCTVSKSASKTYPPQKSRESIRKRCGFASLWYMTHLKSEILVKTILILLIFKFLHFPVSSPFLLSHSILLFTFLSVKGQLEYLHNQKVSFRTATIKEPLRSALGLPNTSRNSTKDLKLRIRFTSAIRFIRNNISRHNSHFVLHPRRRATKQDQFHVRNLIENCAKAFGRMFVCDLKHVYGTIMNFKLWKRWTGEFMARTHAKSRISALFTDLGAAFLSCLARSREYTNTELSGRLE